MVSWQTSRAIYDTIASFFTSVDWYRNDLPSESEARADKRFLPRVYFPRVPFRRLSSRADAFPTGGKKKETSPAKGEGAEREKKRSRSIRKKREACAGSGTALPEGRTSNLGHNRVPLLVSEQKCRYASSSQHCRPQLMLFGKTVGSIIRKAPLL